LAQWLQLQDEMRCFFMIADWHALTNNYRDTSSIPENIRQQTLDWLAVGLDPSKATIFVQSAVKEHAELSLLLGMFTPVGLMERCTGWKEANERGDDVLRTYGFLGYPCLQTADILMYQAHVVPVGKDQQEHVEKAQDIAQKVNFLYGTETNPVFRVPEWQLGTAPMLPGNDGRKMSKSYDNCIYITEDAATVEQKVSIMVTDPARVRRHDPGNPEKCSVWEYHKVFTDKKHHDWIWKGCTTAGIGCRDCKKLLAERSTRSSSPCASDARRWRRQTSTGGVCWRPATRTRACARGNDDPCARSSTSTRSNHHDRHRGGDADRRRPQLPVQPDGGRLL
jgi:tryptophanyl-tRNA synthetase